LKRQSLSFRIENTVLQNNRRGFASHFGARCLLPWPAVCALAGFYLQS
jgi:hypothetical protein